MRRRTTLGGLGAMVLLELTGTRRAMADSIDTKGNHMIIVTVEVEFENDGIHEKRDAIKAMDEATAMEEGCIAYKSSFDATNPRILRIYEMWESMDALVPHFKTRHMAEFQAALSGLAAKGMDAKVYEVARELPFPN
ncbi:putative quinol monooxygenase [Ruegeria sp. Ofav3-42]|uniref:putative quinol monooxygenase n=1 Tax=Ruegeria sp. Ofav3-42 TaxID=2917759 RepID=UPI001EF5BD7F|nr:putative quinol monooxygenase [Ruegeria sp. Ofav3-42]MCG7522796.1 antibiotic biosynthesis monooxygenase [Ruegeria sp. Ofav3-42]